MKISKETRQKMREAKFHNPTKYWLGKKRPNMVAEKNPAWKGEKVGYRALHIWIRRNFGKPFKCENPDCIYPRMGDKKRWMLQPKRFDWANKSKEYSRNKEDWFMLCVSCHKKYDLKYAKSL